MIYYYLQFVCNVLCNILDKPYVKFSPRLKPAVPPLPPPKPKVWPPQPPPRPTAIKPEQTSSSIVATVEQSSTYDSVIRGVALLGDHLYVLHMRAGDHLDELDAHNLQLQRQLSVPDESWRHLSDMASCQRRRRLYISHNTSNCVYVLALTAVEAWSTWMTDGSPWGLSVTPDTGNLFVTMRYVCRVDEYSPEGQCLRRVDLQRSGAFCPWHALQLSSIPSEPEMLLVGHGDRTDDAVRVGLVRVLDGRSGVGKCWYGGRPGDSGHLLTRPQHLAIGRNGTIAVADVFNDRVVLLDDQLQHISDVEASAGDREAGWLTARVFWIGRRLCVAEVQSIEGKFTAARITIYDLPSLV